jgi:hypothetical protein
MGCSFISKRDLRDVLNGLHERSEAGQVLGGDAAQHACFELLYEAGDLKSGFPAGRGDGQSEGSPVIGIERPSGESRRFQTIQHAGEGGWAMPEDLQDLPDRAGAVNGQIRQEMGLSPIQSQVSELPREMQRNLPAGLVERGKNPKRHGASSV